MDYCNYCGENFIIGEPVRKHHRGISLHELCYIERSQSPTFQAKYYADQASAYEEGGE